MSKRFIVYDRQLRPLFDLDGRVTEATRYERINGEHKLDIKTTQPLDGGLRILTRDGTLKWREWVVDEPQEHKQDYDVVEGSYGCTWSMQYDLSRVSGGELWPGTYDPITAGAALAMVLATQRRWEVGRVTVSTVAGTSLFDGQVWDYLGKLQDVWGGEFEPRIEVDSNGVTHRYVDWLAHVGSAEATRRFDYGEDCTSIDRKPPVGPMCCRIVPRGGNDATDEDGISYSNRVGVEEEPYSSGDGWVHDAGSKWVRDPEAEELFKTPNPDGTWHYPELVVTYDTDDPEELLQRASADIHKYTRPSPTYEADVLQFVAAGMDAHGVELGDVVHVVDRKFGDAPLRIEARIVEMTVNELDESDVQLVIGEATRGIESALKSMRDAMDATAGRVRRIEGDATIIHIDALLDAINAEINGTGGYSYFVPGEGIITYDRAVADPLVGTEATFVTQMKGGSLRFAKTKKPAFSGINDWEWTNVITSDGYIGLAAAIGAITSGYIGSASSGNYWNLDTGEFRMAATSMVGDQTLAQYIGDNLGLTQQEVFDLLTNNGALQGLYMSGGQLYVNASYINTGYLSANRIQGGSLTLGGANNVNGILQVKDASGNVISTLDNTGANIKGQLVLVTKGYRTNGTVTTELGTIDDIPTITANGRSVSTGTSYKGLQIYGTSEYPDTRSFIVIDRTVLNGYRATIIGSTADIRLSPFVNLSTAFADMVLERNAIRMFGGSSSGDKYRQTIDSSGIRLDYIGGGYQTPAIYTSDGSSLGGKLDVTGTVEANHLKCSRLDLTDVHAESGYFSNYLYCPSGAASSGVKSRVVGTADFGERMLYCYETTRPYFGDIGSATIDEDGIGLVTIDPVFAETVRTDFEYQVFLQARGRGELWVDEKHATHFVVRGTPGMAFDWEVKLRQVGLENLHMDSFADYRAPFDAMSDARTATKEAVATYGNVGREATAIAEKTLETYDDYLAEVRRACVGALTGR